MNSAVPWRPAEQLEQVIRDHVAERARLLVKPATRFHANGFSRCDLHVIDVFAPENRLEQRVREAHREDALNRVLAKKMVDTINLVLGGELEMLSLRSFADA